MYQKVDSSRMEQETATRRGVGSGVKKRSRGSARPGRRPRGGVTKGRAVKTQRSYKKNNGKKKKEELNPQHQTATIAVAVEEDDGEELGGGRMGRTTRSRLGGGNRKGMSRVLRIRTMGSCPLAVQAEQGHWQPGRATCRASPSSGGGHFGQIADTGRCN